MAYQISVHGVPMLVESESRDCMAFLAEYFLGFPVSSDTPVVACSIRFLPGYSWRLHDIHHEYPHTLGSGIGWNDDNQTLHVEEREWATDVTVAEHGYRGTLTFKKNFWKHMINVLANGRAETRKRYYRAAVRQIPQQLLFLALSQKGIGAHSGAAVSFGGKAYVFAGLPGSGKSTLAHALKERFGGAILTENFVLTDGTSVFPFPEGNAVSSMAPQKISGIYTLSHGTSFNVCPIAKEDGLRHITIIDDLTAELPRHAKIAAIGLASRDLKNPPEEKALSIPFFELTADKGLEKTISYFSSL